MHHFPALTHGLYATARFTLEYKREGIEALYKLKKEGRLSEFDDRYITEAENELKEIKSKLGK